MLSLSSNSRAGPGRKTIAATALGDEGRVVGAAEMSTPIRIALTIAELLAAGVLGGMAWAWWACPREPVELHDEAATEDRERERPLFEAYLRTQAVVGRSLNAHVSLQARLVAVSDSALEHAQVLERLHEAGMAPRRVRANADWQPRRNSRATSHAPVRPRRGRHLTGPSTRCWRRSMNRMRAVSTTPAPTRRLGAPRDPSPTGWPAQPALDLAAGCSFCAKRRQDVHRLIAGPGIYICDECVALCAEIMEEQDGTDWREQADRRLRGEDNKAE